MQGIETEGAVPNERWIIVDPSFRPGTAKQYLDLVLSCASDNETHAAKKGSFRHFWNAPAEIPRKAGRTENRHGYRRKPPCQQSHSVEDGIPVEMSMRPDCKRAVDKGICKGRGESARSEDKDPVLRSSGHVRCSSAIFLFACH